MSSSLRLALCQINPTVGDIEGNLKLIEQWRLRALEADARLIAFPELSLTGYPPEDLLLSKSFVRDAEDALQRLAASTGEEVLLVGSPEFDRADLYNGLSVLTGGSVVARYRKCRLPNYGVFDEVRYFAPGDGGLVIEVDGLAVGLSICEDIWFSGSPASDCVSAGAQIIVNVSASPFHAGKGEERIELLRKRSREHGVPLAYCALVGGQDELVFDGQSLLVDKTGNVVAKGKQFSEDLVVVDLEVSPGQPPRPIAVTEAPVAASAIEEIRGALSLGLSDYVAKNGFSGVVLGMSGGIDSAVAAAVAVDSLGADKVTGVVMPSPWSSQETQSDAREICKRLGITWLEFSISALMDSYATTLGTSAEGPGSAVAEENIQARIRGNLLMALSNAHGWLVITTGNKSELAVGYSTLYGDAAGGFGILKDVPKTTVYSLARHFNEAGEAAIPQSIIDRAPSAELRPGQRDDQSLPPYDVLDPIIQLHVEEALGTDQIAAEGFERETVARILSMIDRAEYKRRQYPPGVKITPLAFGRDRRMPMTNRFRA